MKARKKCDISILNCEGSDNFFYNKHYKSLEIFAILVWKNFFSEAFWTKSDLK
jgi:hypothetical protein